MLVLSRRLAGQETALAAWWLRNGYIFKENIYPFLNKPFSPPLPTRLSHCGELEGGLPHVYLGPSSS